MDACCWSSPKPRPARPGFAAVTLYTHEMMTENQELYARIGYRETHRGIGGDNFSRVYMCKALT